MTGFGGRDVAVGQISYMGTSMTRRWMRSANPNAATGMTQGYHLVAGRMAASAPPDRTPDKYVVPRHHLDRQLCARRLNSAVVMDIA
jgi:hypothetical protein